MTIRVTVIAQNNPPWMDEMGENVTSATIYEYCTPVRPFSSLQDSYLLRKNLRPTSAYTYKNRPNIYAWNLLLF